ncbi:Spo0E family sporulation regulatory protein-aspartic acid phosphatase [Virgibacillus byunsanensis]|uniref:Spo0E family sporulation regulatory protein-aspartic acid phosphatase n=1 Tax=Virgibacillus byunsanensis TaxID=570945 RepID=A0ABW3LJQ9_9BACI
MDNSILLQKIEQCRNEMITLSNAEEFTSDAVIKSSKRLDTLLNEYQRKVNNRPQN